MVFGNCGVLTEIGPGKGFVEMSSVDPETSIDIGEVCYTILNIFEIIDIINMALKNSNDY